MSEETMKFRFSLTVFEDLEDPDNLYLIECVSELGSFWSYAQDDEELMSEMRLMSSMYDPQHREKLRELGKVWMKKQ